MTLAMIFSVLAMLLWTTSNFIDKILLSRFAKEGSVNVLMIFSGLIGLCSAPIYLLIDPSALSLSPEVALLVVMAGFLNILGVWCYLYALNEDDTSTVVPFMQLIPVFVLVFAFLILGETLSWSQILLGALIVLGGALLSLDLHASKFKVKVTLFMLGSAAFWALFEVFNKFFSLDYGFFVAGFWQSVSLILVSFGILAFKVPREQFVMYVKESGIAIFGANAANEVINIAGNGFYLYATLFAPIALVSLTHAYQGVVAFIIGLLLTVTLPQLIREDTSPKVLIQKVIAILIMSIASYFLIV